MPFRLGFLLLRQARVKNPSHANSEGPGFSYAVSLQSGVRSYSKRIQSIIN